MCGFFGISDRSLIDTDFSDIDERGEISFSATFNSSFFHQSILSVNGKFPGSQVFDTGDYYFTYVGEIYNAPTKGFANDTEWLAEKIRRQDYNFDEVNVNLLPLSKEKFDKLAWRYVLCLHESSFQFPHL